MEERATGILVRLGGLLSEPARARMLLSLMDGQQRPATELAQLAQVTPQTASAHLRLLVDSGAVTVAPQGRHRYYRLASEGWAETWKPWLIRSRQARVLLPTLEGERGLRRIGVSWS